MRYLLLILSMLVATISHAESSSTFLPVEQAFPFTHEVENNALVVNFDTAEGYYLYHKRFSFKSEATQLALGKPIFSSQGQEKQDPNFGSVLVYHQPLTIRIPFEGEGEAKIRYQGCADDGLCYLPQTEVIELKSLAQFVPEEADAKEEVGSNDVGLISRAMESGTQELSGILQQASAMQALALFFVLGLGLSLTPCVLPMIPILSSIIGGQGEGMSGWKGFRISLAYVLGMATSYALAGILTATLGQSFNLQVAMQQTWVLVLFASLFVLLALAMFGLYELQLPSRIQVALNSQSQRLTGGKVVTVYLMGAISALVVSPCISAPLAGVLLYVSTTQDWVFGGMTLFMMALGMGVPLIAIGTSGGKFLPRSGPWMIRVKQGFGLMLLAVAILLVSRFAEPWVTLVLWACLLISAAIQFGALESAQSGWERSRKSVAFVTLVYGVMLFVGAMTGADDPFDPLSRLSLGTQVSETALPSRSIDKGSKVFTNVFTKVTTVSELESQMITSSGAQQITMMDLYADWCASCKVMEKTVFQQPEVIAQLAGLNPVKFDVTANTGEQAAWLSSRNLFGPPAMLFFDPEGKEIESLRLVGEFDKQQFLTHLKKVTQ